MSNQWVTTDNFKEEIIAETYGVLPRMQLINQVSSVAKVGGVKPANDNDVNSNGNLFSQYYAKECRKQPRNVQQHNADSNGAYDAINRRSAVDMDGALETYNHYARPAYFCMTIATTDLKG